MPIRHVADVLPWPAEAAGSTLCFCPWRKRGLWPIRAPAFPRPSRGDAGRNGCQSWLNERRAYHFRNGPRHHPDRGRSAHLRASGAWGHLLQTLTQAEKEPRELLHGEMRYAWLARMRGLLRAMPCPVVLLWLGPRRPDDPWDIRNPFDPLYVDRDMLDALAPMWRV